MNNISQISTFKQYVVSKNEWFYNNLNRWPDLMFKYGITKRQQRKPVKYRTIEEVRTALTTLKSRYENTESKTNTSFRMFIKNEAESILRTIRKNTGFDWIQLCEEFGLKHTPVKRHYHLLSKDDCREKLIALKIKFENSDKSFRTFRKFLNNHGAGILRLIRSNGWDDLAEEFNFKKRFILEKKIRTEKTIKKSWTLEEILEIARKYTTSSEWSKGHNKTYSYARLNGWLKQACAHMTYLHAHFSEEEELLNAQKYASITEWRKHDNKSYVRCKRKPELMKKCCAHHHQLQRIIMTREERVMRIKQSASLYKSKVEWKHGDAVIYHQAAKLGLVRKLFPLKK
jgi:hypothetical protein